MNAPMPGQQQPMPGGPSLGGPPTSPVGGYPSGADVVTAEQGQDGMVDNPVIAGVRAIMMFAKELQDRQDPRAQPIVQALGGLIQAMSGTPQDSPMPPPAASPGPPGAGQAGPMGPMPPEAPPAPGGPMPGRPAPGGPMPEAAPAMAPGAGPQGMAFNPFEPPPEQQKTNTPKAVPMQRQPVPSGKRPVVLT